MFDNVPGKEWGTRDYFESLMLNLQSVSLWGGRTQVADASEPLPACSRTAVYVIRDLSTLRVSLSFLSSHGTSRQEQFYSLFIWLPLFWRRFSSIMFITLLAKKMFDTCQMLWLDFRNTNGVRSSRQDQRSLSVSYITVREKGYF